jgi:hypothetical protein
VPPLAEPPSVRALKAGCGSCEGSLVHSIAEAKRHATRNIEYAPELRIECYSRLCLISEWIFDYHAGSWVEQVVSSNAALYRKLQP